MHSEWYKTVWRKHYSRKVSLYNANGYIQGQCFRGVQLSQPCKQRYSHTLEIAICEMDHILCLQSPVLLCIVHRVNSYLYLHDTPNPRTKIASGPLKLHSNDRVLNAVPWWTLHGFNGSAKHTVQQQQHRQRKYHASDCWVSNFADSVLNGDELNQWVDNLSTAYTNRARHHLLHDTHIPCAQLSKTRMLAMAEKLFNKQTLRTCVSMLAYGYIGPRNKRVSQILRQTWQHELAVDATHSMTHLLGDATGM